MAEDVAKLHYFKVVAAYGETVAQHTAEALILNDIIETDIDEFGHAGRLVVKYAGALAHALLAVDVVCTNCHC